jgi:phage baseplate assembly protein W
VTHVAYPLRTTARGRTATADDDAYVRGLVEAVIFTRSGERPNRPDFGSGIEQLVFGPVDDEAAHATQALVHGALQRHLGEQLRVEEVSVEAVETALRVTVAYRSLLGGPSTERRTLTVVGGGA